MQPVVDQDNLRFDESYFKAVKLPKLEEALTQANSNSMY